MKKSIFILEDDAHIQELLRYNLDKDGYNIRLFGDADDILRYADKEKADLFLLDIMVPGEFDGYQVCRKLKEDKNTSHIPIIFLTAKSEEFDTVLGLELGAEDYIKKPFGIKELTTRIKVALRRSDTQLKIPAEIKVLTLGHLTIDFEKHLIFKDKKELLLPLKEYELLRILMENPGRVFSRDQLLEKVWGFEYSGETRTVDVHIRYLRQKIEENDNDPKLILTVRGIGYKFTNKQEST